MESNENPSSVSRGPVSEESSTESDSDSFSKTVCVSRTRKKCIIEDSDSDSSGSFIDVIRKRKRTVNHLISDSDSSGSSSGSEVVRRKRSATRISSDSDSDFGPKKQAAVQAAASSSSDSDGQSEKCPICLITFKSQEVASPEACDHCFCVECIQEWSKNVNTCPVDRQPFNIILVRKNLNGKIIKQIPVQPSNQADNEVVIDDPTFCEVCGSSDREDRMLLCDGCDLGYHLECLNPPLDDVPPGVWYCSYCGPEEANQDVNIYLQEVELLLNDAEDMARPNGPRRTNATRLIPRTRQSERVRARVMTNRTRNRANSEQVEEIQVVVRHGASTSTASVSRSRPTTRRKRRKKRKQPRIRITYEIDETTGEEIRIETKTRRYKKKRRKKKRGDRVAARPKTVKKRLAVQLGICRPKQAQQTIPEVTNNPPNTSIGFRRSQAGIPSLHLFGTEDLLTCSEGEDDYGFGVVARRPNFSDVSALRRSANRKAVLLPAADGGGTCDILSSIMENQEKLYSKKNTLAVKNDGRILALPRDLNSNENRVDLNDLSNVRIRAAPTYSTSSSSSSGAVNTNVNGGNSEYRAAYSSSNPSEEVPMNSSVSTSGRDERYEGNQAEVVQNLSEEDKKKNEASESDLDIYSDIETVSTSKEDVKADSPVVANINLQSDEETNNSDVDLVIDTEKEKEDQEKEKEETVTSTTQMETVLEEDKDEEEEEEEDGCPNFSIYSTETLNVAKTDLDVLQIMDKTQNSDEVGSSEDVVESGKAKVDDSKEQEEQKKDLGLYSDSDDEMVKIDGNNKPFQIGDISAMTEDISEDERSYTPCLDEKNAKEFLDGLDTEAISDEEKNDFDESHEFKTVSDGDALEINAKESELDFTRVEDFEEGEIVDKSKSKKVEEEEKKEENKENREVQKIVEKEEKKTEEKEKEKEKDSGFKKISKSNKERNYRDKERSKSREKKKDKKKEKRKEIERYNVRSVVAEKPRRMKDKFGRDARRRSSSSRSNSPYRSSSRNRRSYSRSKGRRRTQRRSRSHSRSRSRRRSRSKIKRRNNSVDRKRRKSRPRSKKRSRSFSPRRRRDWKYSISKSKSPEGRRGASPSWTPPRVVENPVKNNLTVILTNDSKKRRDKKKVDKKGKKEAEKKKRKRDKTPPPSKEVFASGDNILVSVSFNEESSVKRNKRDRVEKVKDVKAQRKKVNDLSSVKPVAIIDLDRSPFKELTPSPNDVIVLSDSDNNENLPQENVCDSSQQPENYAIRELRTENYGPKTPPEPQVKFSLNPKATQIRAINNPLHEPDDLVEIETQAEVEHKGPNTPPEPPNSPPSSPDAYDPFDPTKSRSPTPDKCEKKQEKEVVVEKVEEVKPQTPDVFKKSHTPPVVPEIQAADSQSNAIPAEIVKTSPERTIISVTKSTPQTTYSIAPLVTSTPISTNPPRINILNTTILTTPTTSSSAITPRNPLPKPTIKISPTKNMSIKKMNESNESCEFDSPYSPGPSDYEDLFEPPAESTTPAPSKPKTNNAKTSNQKAQQNAFDNLFGSSPKVMGSGSQSKNSMKNISNSADRKKKNSKAKIVGVKMDEESLKILDDVPNSAVEMQVKDKFLKKLNRQERVVEEVKLVLKPHYNKKHINKEEYKDILRRSVPKICHNKSGEINPKKIQNLIEAYVKKIRHSKKVTSSSNTLNPQK